MSDEYPEVTEGSILARKVRDELNRKRKSESARSPITVPQIRNADLERRNAKMETLIVEILNLHSNPEMPEYNECDKFPCFWCEQAKALMPLNKE